MRGEAPRERRRASLSDGARSGRPREIDDADRAFVVDLACQRPADPGYAAELWTNDLLTAHVRKVAEAAGHPRLATVATGSVHNILADAQTEPHKMAHCRERRDPNFRAKMHNVLLLHEQLSFRFDEDGDLIPWEEGQEAHVPSNDERPGTRDAREHRTRPATRRGRRTRPAARQGHGQARPRAREARDAPRLDRPADRRGDPPRARRTRAPTTSSSSGSSTASTLRAT